MILTRINLLIILWSLVFTPGLSWKLSPVPGDSAHFFVQTADSLIEVGKTKAAIDFYRKAEVIYESRANWKDYFQVNSLLINVLIDIGEYDEAIKKCKLAIYNPLNPLEFVLETYSFYGYVLYQKGLYGEAEKVYKTGLTKALESEDKDNVIVSKFYSRLGICYYAMSKPDLALEMYKQALSTGLNELNKADIMDKMGIIYAQKALYDTAIHIFTNSLEIKKDNLSSGDVQLAGSYNYLGLVNWKLGNLEEAMSFLKKSLKIRISSLGNENRYTADCYNNIGLVYQHLGQDYNAIEFLKKALSIRLTVFGSSHPEVAGVYNNMAISFEKIKDYEKALKYNFQALRIKQEFLGEQHRSTANTFRNIGLIYSKKGMSKEAMEMLQKSRLIMIDIFGEKHPDVAKVNNLIAMQFVRDKNYNQALVQQQNVIDVLEEIYGKGSPELALAYYDYATILKEEGHCTKALTHFQQALILNSKHFKGRRLEENPSFDDFYRPGIIITTLFYKAETLYSQFLEEHNDKALKNALLALTTLDSVVDKTGEVYENINDFKYLHGDLVKAYQLSIKVCDELRRLTEDESYLLKAFYFSEKSKASLLRNSLSGLRALSNAGLPDSVIQQEKNLKKELLRFDNEIRNASVKKDTLRRRTMEEKKFDLERKYANFIKQLEIVYPQYHRLRYDHTGITVDSLYERLEDNEAILEYVTLDSLTYCFILEKGYINLITLGSTDIINSAIKKLMRSFSPQLLADYPEESYFNYVASAHELYQLLFKKCETTFSKHINRLVIIPDGLIGYIPFEVILANDHTRSINHYGSLSYLLRKFTISYSYSASLRYNRYMNSLNRKNNLIAFAPSYKEFPDQKTSAGNLRNNFTALRWNEEEVNKISAYFKTTSYISDNATEAIFKHESANYDIIHLAMHAIVDDSDPLTSKLIFSSNSNSIDDGVLHVYELYNMTVPAKMVVLSACNTGSGLLAKGEGVMSMAHAFSYAGCPSTVVSYWKVDDASTSKLMSKFYEELSAELDKDVALRNAKLSFLNDANGYNNHPYYWGGFVVIGNIEPITIEENYNIFLLAILLAGLLGIVFLLIRRRSESV